MMPWYAVNRIGDIAAQQQRKKKDVHNFEKKYKSEDDKANESRQKKTPLKLDYCDAKKHSCLFSLVIARDWILN